MNNFAEIIIPFLSDAQIGESAELFRRQYWNSSVPVDVEKIIDVKLGINIIPIPNLIAFCDTDALITSSFVDLYVDHDKFLDERYQNRLRFSLAHELGHLMMHKDLYNSFCINEFADYYALFQRISADQYGYLEAQANRFAGHLLVPPDRLREEKEKLLRLKGDCLLGRVDKDLLNAYLAVPLSGLFGVSELVVQIAPGQLK